MAFSRASIGKAEDQAKAQFGIECRYSQATSQWHKVVNGIVTPFNLKDANDRAVRDFCRLALSQADYDEQRAAEAAAQAQSQNADPDPQPPPQAGGMWGQMLTDRNVRAALTHAAPASARPFIAPALDALHGALSGASSLKEAFSASAYKASGKAASKAMDARDEREGMETDDALMQRVEKSREAAKRAEDREKIAQERENAALEEEAKDPNSQKAQTARTKANAARTKADAAKTKADTAAGKKGVQEYEEADTKARTLADEANAAAKASRIADYTSLAGGFMAGRAAGQSGVGSGLGSFIGGRMGGAAGSALGGAAGMAAEAAIKESYGSGKKAVENFTKGALSLGGAALNAGTQIANQLLSAALRPFGSSGSAVAGLAQGITQSVTGAVMGGAKLASQGASVVGGVAAAGVGGAAILGGAALGAIVGTVMPILTPLIGAGIGAAVGGVLAVSAMKLVEVAGTVIGTVFDTLGTALGELGKIGGQALSTVLTVMDDVKNAAMSLSKAILDMSQQSGMSVSGSAIAVNNLQGFGISPQQSAQMFGRNTLYQQGMDRSWGIHGESGSADNLRDFRRVYQELKAEGHGNPLIANTMARQTGKEALIPMANLPTEKFERSLANGSNLQMSGKAVEQWQQDFGLMMNDLDRFVSYVKVTLGNAFLPAMQKGLGVAVSFFKANQKAIIAGIRAIGHFLYADFPKMALQGAAMVVGGFGVILHALSQMTAGFQHGKGAFFEFVSGFLTGIDKMVFGLRLVLATAAGVGVGIALAMTGVGGVAAGLAGMLTFGVTMAATNKMQTHLGRDFRKYATKDRGVDAQGHRKKGAIEKAHDFFHNGALSTDKLGKSLEARAKGIDSKAMGKDFDGMFGVLSDIRDNTGKKQTVQANVNVNISPQEDFFAKVQSYETWNTWAALGQNGA